VTTGHYTQGLGYYAAGDLPLAIECYKRAIHIAPDPIFAFGTKLLLGMTYVASGQLQEAEDMLGEVMEFNETFGAEFLGTGGQLFQGIITIMRGNLSQGVKTVENLLRAWLENGSRYRYVTGKYMLGKLYLQILQGAGPKSFSFLVKNIGFLVKNVLFADKKAETHFNEAIEVAEEIGAKVILGQAKLDLGMLHKAKGRTDQAQEYISSAIKIFEECEAEIYLKQAKEVIASLG
jgi:tetratricopeptide (TPR) repeat protein